MSTGDKIAEVMSAALAAGESRARISAELLLAAATMYDVESMVSGAPGRREQFVALAASAYDNARAAVKRAAT
jgi:hypothetical protein